MNSLKLILFSLLLTSCAAVNGPWYAEVINTLPAIEKNEARVFFFRCDHWYMKGRSAPINIDGKDTLSIKNNTFDYIDIEHGQHVFMTEIWDSPGKYVIEPNLMSGKEYFIEIIPRKELQKAQVNFGIIGLFAESGGSEKGGALALIPLEEKVAKGKLQNRVYHFSRIN